jgi:hypothetical protein
MEKVTWWWALLFTKYADDSYNIFAQKLEGKRPKRRWEDDIKMDLK